MIELAIVIPAYKAKYFAQTLAAFAAQTNKNFNLYIGDDCSPDDLKTIADNFSGQLTISYTRFDENIGAKHLVRQWKRCINLVNKQEKWLWLFSDDDLLDTDCVANFYAALKVKKNRFDVYRFNTVTIDANGQTLRVNPTGPEEEQAEEMAYYLLKTERGNSMPDHIFSKMVYNNCGGFVETLYAQGADWASSMLFSHEKGICIIPKSHVYWRYSGINISSVAVNNRKDMITGHLNFLEWVLQHYSFLKKSPAKISYAMMVDAIMINLRKVMIYHFKGFNTAEATKLVSFYKKIPGISFTRYISELFVIKQATLPWLHRASDFMIRLKDAITRRVLKPLAK